MSMRFARKLQPNPGTPLYGIVHNMICKLITSKDKDNPFVTLVVAPIGPKSGQIRHLKLIEA